MSGQQSLSSHLEKIENEIRSNKALPRQKALEKLDQILNDRSDDLINLLQNDTWINLLDSAHEAIIQQSNNLSVIPNKGLALLETRSAIHKTVIQKLLTVANGKTMKISIETILEKCFHCFSNQTISKYFGECYLQILQKYVLSSSGVGLEKFGDIKTSDWCRMASYCFDMYEKGTISKLIIFHCISLIIDYGCTFGHLLFYIKQYIPNMKEIATEKHDFSGQKEMLKTVFYFTKHLVLDYRYDMCEFTENCCGSIVKIYNTSLDNDTKDLIFKFFYLSIIIHCPSTIENDSTTDVKYAANVCVWNSHLRNIFCIVKKEIRYLDGQVKRYETNPKMSQYLLELGSELCLLLYWHLNVWNNDSSDGEHSSKRQRRSDKLEGVMELVTIEQGKFSWRWLNVLAEVINKYPEKILIEDFQQLLQLAADFQQTISHSIQISILSIICNNLMQKFKQFSSNDNNSVINETFCNTLWEKMAETAFRRSSSNTENIRFIQLYFRNQQNLPKNFIVTLLKALLTNSMEKTNDSIELIGLIFKNFNINSIENCKEIQLNALHWLYPTIQNINLKQVMTSDRNINLVKVAEVTVLCIFSKINIDNNYIHSTPIISSSVENSSFIDYQLFIQKLCENLLYKSLNQLIVSPLSSTTQYNVKNGKSIQLPMANELKSVINEELFQNLFVILNEKDNEIEDDGKHFAKFIMHSSKIILYTNILNQLIVYESLDNDRLHKTFLIKRITIKLEQINMALSNLMLVVHDKDSMDILDKLLIIFCRHSFHTVLCEMLCDKQLDMVVNWLEHQTKSKDEENDSSELIVLKSVEDLLYIDTMRYKAFLILSHFCAGINEEHASNIIMNYEFDFDYNGDIFIVHQLIKEFVDHKPSQWKADWIIRCLKLLCQSHQRNRDVMEIIIDLLPDVINFVKDYSTITLDITIIISTLLKQCKSKKYSPKTIEKLITNVKHLARAYPLELTTTDFLPIFLYLEKFLHFQNISIQYTTIDTLSHIFNVNWISTNLIDNTPSFKNFHYTIFDKILERLSAIDAINDEQQKDVFYNIVSVSIQYYSSILCINNILRKKCWFYVAELFYKYDLNQGMINSILYKLCEKMNIDKNLAITDNISYILSKWLLKDNRMADFPWKMTISSTQSDFFYDYLQIVAFNILSHKPHLLEDCVNIIPNETMSTVLKPILPKCFAFLMPMFSECENNPSTSSEVYAILQNNVSDVKNVMVKDTVEIVEHLLFNLWDEQLFQQFFNVEIDIETDDALIDYNSFIKCIKYLESQNDPTTNANKNILIEFCTKNPHNIHLLMLAVKFKIQNSHYIEQKLVHLFHFCVLTHNISNYLVQIDFSKKSSSSSSSKQKSNNINEYLICDITYYLTNLLLNIDYPTKFHVAVCNYFLKFSQSIIPKYADTFKLLLNYIVSILVPIIQKYHNTKLALSAINCLEYLICEQKYPLKDAIAYLDCFPNEPIFENYKEIHIEMKYKNHVFNLADEIEYFLKVDERKLEGFIGLKEHLSSKKEELSLMYEKLNENPSENNIILRLISKLLQTIQRSDVQKNFEAAKCLGELGPYDLSTITLLSDVQQNCFAFYNSFEDAVKHLCEVAIQKLEKLLLHPDARVLKAVCEAISHLFCSKVGQEIINSNFPKLSIFQINKPTISSLYRKPSNSLNLLIIFIEEENSTHSVWIKRITSELFKFFGDEYLEKVAALQIMFADAMFPILIEILLSLKFDSYNKILKDVVVTFFQRHFEIVSQITSAHQNTIYVNKASIKVMLNVAECIRMYNLKNIDNEIILEWIHIAKAAQYCEAYFSSVLYAELWCLQQQQQQQQQEKPQIHTNDEDIISNPLLQNIMQKAYLSVGNTDAVIPFLNPIESRHTYLQINNDWNRLYFELDANNLSENFFNMNNCLASSGLYALANKCETTASNTNYDCAWRLGNWDILTETENISSNNNPLAEFKRQHYLALKCLHTKDEMGVKFALKSARESIIAFIKLAVLECTNNIYQHLTSLELLQEIEDFCEVQFQHSSDESKQIFEKWQHKDTIAYSDFRYKEPVLAQRITIFNTAGIRAHRKLQNFYNMTDIIQSTILQVATLSRKEGKHNLAVRYLATLNSMNLSDKMQSNVLLEDARLSWKLDDQILAKKLLSKCDTIINLEAISSRCCAVRKFGKYLANQNTENVKNVIENYFDKSLQCANSMAEQKNAILAKTKMSSESFDKCVQKNKLKAYQAIAEYSDREYNQLILHMKSENFIKKKKNTNISEENLRMNFPRDPQQVSRDERASFSILRQNTIIDINEIKNIENECKEFLHRALENYLQTCLLQNEINDSLIFRIISLWFANKSIDEINAMLKERIPNISSYKFLLALPQICARISTSNDDFTETIKALIERCAIEHPHHTIAQILALSNAYVDSENKIDVCRDKRSMAARVLIQSLTKNQKTTLIVCQMDEMCKALINLANKTSGGRNPSPFQLNSGDPLHKLKDLNFVQCPTINLPVSIDQNYSNITSICKWDNKVEFVGGINAPKKVTCLCSDGKCYPQLVKGRDDLRQDAVMQQVFTIMNNMLRNNKTTRKEKLKVNTYKVVPLSQRSGILEWCSNTFPLADYLIGKDGTIGAHERYRPQDYKPRSCRDIVIQMAPEAPSIKLRKFKKICDKFKPVMQYFFLENFTNAGMWFEKRLAYTNSVATTSMIGYILGIGDRHVHNILIHKSTAELIHIDFGIAFEQAKCLPTPETIPFRLTRDIVAPFGVSGVDGVFRKSCEKTMQVLRQNKTMIITTLEVLLHDPLYQWTLTNKKSQRRQGVGTQDDSNDADGSKMNTMAERALLRLEAKLNGKDDGTIGSSYTVEAHVELLIRSAMNPVNLSRLFNGWQAYL